MYCLEIEEVADKSLIPLQTFAERLYGPFAFLIPVFVAMSTFGGVNGILLTSSRLFYAGACEGQMPEILSMIQVSKMTPAPAVIVVVNICFPSFSVFIHLCPPTQALLSLGYLCSSDIFALINYVGFATWVSYNLFRIFLMNIF